MSENSVKAENEVNAEEQKDDSKVQKRGRRPKQAVELAKEAESLLKGFVNKEEGAEGRRTTRSATRTPSSTTLTPPPVKKERKTPNSGHKRGRPKKTDVKNGVDDEHETENNLDNQEDEVESDSKGESSKQGTDDESSSASKNDKPESANEDENVTKEEQQQDKVKPVTDASSSENTENGDSNSADKVN